MKLTIPQIGVLSTIVLLVSVGVMYAGSFESLLSNQSSGPTGAAFLTGNVKVTHFDENGYVIGYRMGQNHITAMGMAVIMGQVFAGMNATIPINMSGTVGWMEIGTGGDTEDPGPGPPWTSAQNYLNALRWNDTDISIPVLSAANPACIRVQAISFNASLGNGGQGPAHTSPKNCDESLSGDPTQTSTACAAQMNVTATARFQGDDCGVNGIDEAGIFTHEDGTDGLMFARNTFGSVNLQMGDTLQLEWEFTFKDSI